MEARSCERRQNKSSVYFSGQEDESNLYIGRHSVKSTVYSKEHGGKNTLCRLADREKIKEHWGNRRALRQKCCDQGGHRDNSTVYSRRHEGKSAMYIGGQGDTRTLYIG